MKLVTMTLDREESRFIMRTWLRLCALMLILPLGDARIWQIRLGREYGGHQYFNEDGTFEGFGVDLLDTVCAKGGMDCRMVIDIGRHCMKSNPGNHPSGGIGLFSRWYDGCMGWVPTVIRVHVFAFSKPYMKPYVSYFYVLKGTSFNPNDLAGKTIAFENANANDPQCLARQADIANNNLADSQILLALTISQLIEYLQDKKADAVLGDSNMWSPEQRALLDRVPKEMYCILGGHGLMARKDSAIIAAWNVGFNKLRETNGYAKFCQETVPKHAHKGVVPCLDM